MVLLFLISLLISLYTIQANILLTNELNIVLADFGLAVFAEGVKNQYASLHGGAFQWLPPEAFSDVEDFRPTFSADIYAFACVCIEVRYSL